MPENDKLLDMAKAMGIDIPKPKTLVNLTNEFQDPLILKAKGMGLLEDNDPHFTTTPSDMPQGMFNPKYDTSRDANNVDAEVFNSLGSDAWNSFKRGIDTIQIATAQGKMNYSMFSESAPKAVIDEYPEDVARLEAQLENGIITRTEYETKRSELDEAVSKAQEYVSSKERDIDINEEEIRNEPVSKEYDWMNFVTQSQGDAASLLDKLTYSMPNVVGSSASLMVPQLMATFGSNITKALIRSSAAYLLGPEAGIPANIIGTIGAIAASVAEVTYGRVQESHGEIGSTIMENQQRLFNEELPGMMQEWAAKNGVDLEDESRSTEINNAQEEFKRQLRNKSRKGADVQFKQNMALAAVDIAQAILMPMSNFGSGIGSIMSKINPSKAIEAVRDYNKATRIMSHIGRAALNAEAEKFEEGYQFASQIRADELIQGSITNSNIMSSIMEDSFDTLNSLNYSLIPGIDMRGGGKFANNKEFQFSENSGGMLGLLMGAVPTSIALAKDINAYKQANKALSQNGIMDLDGKFKRLHEQILQRYFEKGDTHHLIQAIASLTNKKDEAGEPVLTKDQATQLINDIKDGQNMYEAISEQVEQYAPKDSWFGFKDSKEQKEAKRAYKADLFHTIQGIQDRNKQAELLKTKKNTQLSHDRSFVNNPEVQTLQDLDSQLIAIDEMISSTRDGIDKGMPGVTTEQMQRHIKDLESRKTDVLKAIKEEELRLQGLNIPQEEVFTPSTELKNINKAIIANELLLTDHKINYSDLAKIKSRKQLKEYREKVNDRFSPLREENTPEEVAPQPAQPTPESTHTVRSFVDNIKRGIVMNEPEDVQFYENNKTEIERILREEAVSEKAPRPKTQPKQEAPIFEAPTPDEELGQQAFEQADEEIRTNFRDILTTPDSPLNRANKMVNFLTSLNIPPEAMTTRAIYEGMFKELFDEDSIRELFPALKDVLKDINKDQDEVFLDEALNLYSQRPIPPIQAGDASTAYNKALIRAINGHAEGTGLRITSGLSIATANVKSIPGPDGRMYDDRDENGRIRFSEQHDQQLVNTNIVGPGKKLFFKVDNVPNTFKAGDLTDSNYDKIEIGVYAEVGQPGSTARIKIGTMHEVFALDRLLAETSDLETEKRILRTNRLQIINNPSVEWHTATVTAKGFGFLNQNENTETNRTTIANLIGTDTRPRISIIDKTGRPVPRGRMELAVSDSTEGMRAGMNVLLIPNETSRGTVYFPALLTKNKLGVDTHILDKVHELLVNYLQPEGSVKNFTEAERYIFVSSIQEDSKDLGKAGVLRILSKSNKKTLQINGKFFNQDDFNPDELKHALSEVYFNVSEDALEKDPTYEQEIMNSPVLTTNIAQNGVLLSRSREGGPYSSFLKGNERYSYFHQHTIVHDTVEPEGTISTPSPLSQYSPQQLDAAAQRYQAQQEEDARRTGTPPVSIDVNEEIVPEEEIPPMTVVKTAEGYHLVLANGTLTLTEAQANKRIKGGAPFVDQTVSEVKSTEKSIEEKREDIEKRRWIELRSIEGKGLENEGDVAYTSDGRKVVRGKNQKDKYRRGNIIYIVDGTTHFIDYYNYKPGESTITSAKYTRDPRPIHAKYDAELAALESAKTPEPVQPATQTPQEEWSRPTEFVKGQEVRVSNDSETEHFTGQKYRVLGVIEAVRKDGTAIKIGGKWHRLKDLDWPEARTVPSPTIETVPVQEQPKYTQEELDSQIRLRDRFKLEGRNTSTIDAYIKKIEDALGKKDLDDLFNRSSIPDALPPVNPDEINLDDLDPDNDLGSSLFQDVSMPTGDSKNTLLVSPDITASLQAEMVDSLAFVLLNTQKDGSDQTNAERVRAVIQDVYNTDVAAIAPYEALLNSSRREETIKKFPNIEDKVENKRKVISNYRLMLDNFEGLIERARRVLKNLDIELDEEGYFYEGGEENITENTQFMDDYNRQRDEKAHIPPDVKKLMYFLPNLEEFVPTERNPTEPKEYKDTGYQPILNSLGLASFNNFNDTWEKVLSVLTGIDYPSSREGYAKMIARMSRPESPAIVRELARRLEDVEGKFKTTEQTRNAFFRKTNLQLVRNRTMLFVEDKIADQVRVDPNGKKIQNRKSFGRLTYSDQRQQQLNTLVELENEFRIANTGILVKRTEEHIDREIWTVDTEYAQKLHDQLAAIIAEPTNRVAIQGKGNLKDKIGNRLTDAAKDQIYTIVKDGIGLNISRKAFDDLLRFHGTGKAKLTSEVGAVQEVILDRTLKAMIGDSTSQYGSYDKNNPFKINKANMAEIATFEYKYRKQLQQGAYRYAGKSYYPYGRHNYLSEIFTKLNEFRETGVDNFVNQKMSNDVLAQHSRYLKFIRSGDRAFINTFDLYYELGGRNITEHGDVKMLSEMTTREHQLMKLRWFQNQGNRAALFHYDTLSDKTTKPVIQAQKIDVIYDSKNEGIDTKNISLHDNTMNVLYQYFVAEYDRIQLVRRQNEDFKGTPHKLIKDYHDIGNKEGMGKFFNIYYFLNKEILDENMKYLSDMLYNQDGSFKHDLKDLPEGVKGAVKLAINNHMNKVFSKTKADFKALGLYDVYTDEKGNLITDISDLVDHGYLTHDLYKARNNRKLVANNKNASKIKNPGVLLKLGLETHKDESLVDQAAAYHLLGEENINKIVDYTVVDYVVNYVVFSNEMLLITGDPAQAGKTVKEGTLMQNIESTYTNLLKRNASFLGSGEKGLFDTGDYRVAMAKDIPIGSKETLAELEMYKSWFPDNVAGVEKAYSSGDLTDAQEFTTVEEHLHVMKAFGKINESTYRKALYQYDPEAYKMMFSEPPLITTYERLVSLPKVIMQPMKPVQRTNTYVDGISKQYYIKTSSYPLIPSMVDGAMKQLLNGMRVNNINRVSFNSGVKQGISGSKDIFNTDKETGEITFNQSFFENNSHKLSRDGFRIQLEVPYKASKDHIREVTQLSKLLFVDIPEHLEVTFQGKDTTMADLKEKYVKYHEQIIDIKTKELLKEIGVPESGDFNKMNLKRLSQILIKEGEGRGYAMNSLLGLQLTPDGEFEVPLTFLPNATSIEPVITSIVSNRISRLQMPGKSYVQGSEFVLRTGKKGSVQGDEVLKDNRSIVWTKPEYVGLEKLLYLRKENGIVKPAQIVMPFYFIDKNGDRVNVANYINKSTGLLDASRIDPDLLEMNGLRIPFQGHNSGMWFEIVGFLPEEAGDLIIVPGQIAGQMGSDYDVDKLYAYMYNYDISGTHIHKVKSTDPSTEAELQNAIIDIQKAIFTHPDENIQRAILNPLSFHNIEETIEEFGSQIGSEFLGAFDPGYQRDVYFSNITGKDGTAISANANVGHALAQTSNLYIKGKGFVFRDKDGNIQSDYIDPGVGDTNRVTEFKTDTYSDEVDESGESNNNNTPENRSAWRLDKIWTFPDPEVNNGKPFKISDLISQVLGVSVDNAKEQKIGAFGINNQNFNVVLSIIRAGFNFRTVYAFINQPILKEYYEGVGSTQDIFNVDYSAGKRDAIINALYQKAAMIGRISPETLEDILSDPNIEGYTIAQMRDSLKGGITVQNAIQQIQILKAFLYYKTISDSLQKITSTFNVDVKGNPKNMSETARKVMDINTLKGENDTIGNVQNYVKKTIPGLFLHVPALTTSIFMNPRDPMFAYSSSAYTSAINTVSELTGRKDLNQEKIDDLHQEMKKFIYSGFSAGEDIAAIRRRLLFDYPENESLQTRLISLKRANPKNDFLNAIQVETSIYPENPKLLKIPMNSEDNYVQRVSEYWEHALYQDKNPELSKFAQDLVKYALFVSPQEYGLSNIIKYLPGRVQQEGFTKYLRDLNKTMNDPHENIFRGFARQFVQHNPDFLISVSRVQDPYIKRGNFEKIQRYNEVENRWIELRGVLNSFTFPAISSDPNLNLKNLAMSLTRTKTIEGKEVRYYPEFLAYYISPEYGKHVYQKVDNPDGSSTYYRIDKLGSTDMSEYTMNSLTGVHSVIKSNQSTIQFPETASSVPQVMPQAPRVEDVVDPEYLVQGANAEDILDRMISTANDIIKNDSSTRENVIYAKYYAFIASTMKNKGLNTLDIVLYEDLAAAAATQGDGNIMYFNPNKISQGRTGLSAELEKQRVILHEFTHALAFRELGKGRRGSQEFKNIELVWEEFKRELRNQSNEKIRKINLVAFEAELFATLKKEFDKQNKKSEEVSRKDFATFIGDIISDDRKLRDILNKLGPRLQELAEKGEISKDNVNYDLTKDEGRYQDFKAHIVGNFFPELKDKLNMYYSYTNIHEFITEAMTSKKTQEQLQGMASIWPSLVSALKKLLMDILGISQEERTLFDDSIDSIMKFIGTTPQDSVTLDQTQQISNIDTFRYFGKDYRIVLDPIGKGIDVVGYQGTYAKMKVILDYYNTNPNVDPQNGKPFRNVPKEVTPTIIPVVTSTNKEDLLNEGQREAVAKAMNILEASTHNDIYDDMFLLSGKGGTGKTFTTEVIYDKIKNTNRNATILHIAPTWNAVNEVIKASSTNGYQAKTFASFVGTKLSEPDEKTHIQKFILFTEKQIRAMKVPPGVFYADYIIIDEASMIDGDGQHPRVIGRDAQGNDIIESTDAWQTLLYRLDQRQAWFGTRPKKILFVGDYAQIPPVGTTTDHDAYIIERMMQKESTYHVLLENMRTGNEDLNELHEKYRINIDAARRAFKEQGIPSNQSIERSPVPFNERRDTKNISWIRSAEIATDKYVDLYLQDPGNVTQVVFVNYNAYTRPETQNLVKAIRNKLFGADANNTFNPGELILLKGNMKSDVVIHGIKKEIEFHNETRFYVNEVSEGEVREIKIEAKDKGNIHKPVLGMILKLTTDVGKDRITFEQFVPYPTEVEKVFGSYNGSIKGYMVDGRIVPYAAFLKVKDSLPKFDYGYVVNSHKVQGSTYNHTIVDEQNILSSPASNKEVNNMIYTAVSRPKHSLTVLNVMNPDQSNQPVQTTQASAPAPKAESPYPGQTQGIDISTRSTDPLGRALTNPVWGSRKDGKNYFDVETVYKQSKATIKNQAMSYKMPTAENLVGRDTTTLELAEQGLRTATTRSFPLGSVGDIITFEGRPQKYVITGVEQLTAEKVNDPNWIQSWSKKELWTPEHFRRVLGGSTVHVGSFQTSFQKIDDAEVNARLLNKDMNTMYSLIGQKFLQNPELLDEITNRGGIEFLKKSSHIVGVANSRWEGVGEQSNFIRVLIEAYKTASAHLGKQYRDEAITDAQIEEYIIQLEENNIITRTCK